ncbi:uncharacterized protein METZ01_LOCUS85832 [marine metagenome]|uniref:Uncharacterized protein n=1 Tax=marine metagenome TaxID=408172 RepID=A0A381UZD4_9ZZZZ
MNYYQIIILNDILDGYQINILGIIIINH